MNRPTQSQLNKYYRAVSRAIVCDRKQRSDFLKELKIAVSEYIAAENADMDMVTAYFGTPEEIANSFIENCDTAAVRKRLDIRKYLLAFLVVVLLAYLVFVIVSLIDVHTEAHGYLEEGIMLIGGVKGGGVP